MSQQKIVKKNQNDEGCLVSRLLQHGTNENCFNLQKWNCINNKAAKKKTHKKQE